ncbi:MAG TPA: DUF4272 domain-containing protein [Micromonosporaceae bacterium]
MSVPAPDPVAVRAASVEELRRLRLPEPPDGFPLVWEPGDEVDLRPRPELEARAAILTVVLARSFGMPPDEAVGWLYAAGLGDALTEPERQFVTAGDGDEWSFALHLDALYGLAWLLGLTPALHPADPCDDTLVRRFPDLPAGESYQAWLARTLSAVRQPGEAAAALDLYYCLDWAYLEAERTRQPLPGLIDSNAIGQRRWALEWAVVLRGPFHGAPPGWEEIDLSV